MTKLSRTPTLMQKMISGALKFGLVPFLIPGKKIIMGFKCPKCKSKWMIKFIKQPDFRNKIHACKDCGYRYMTPGWKKHHGTFLTGVIV